MTDNAPDTRSGAVRILALTHEQFRYTSENSTVYSWPMKPKTHIRTAATLHALAAERDRLQEVCDNLFRINKELGEAATESVNAAEKAEAEVSRLRAALFECQEEIDDYIQHEYPHDHPVQERYRQRDYAANPARLALQEKPHD